MSDKNDDLITYHNHVSPHNLDIKPFASNDCNHNWCYKGYISTPKKGLMGHQFICSECGYTKTIPINNKE